jgi:hypothetical protein
MATRPSDEFDPAPSYVFPSVTAGERKIIESLLDDLHTIRRRLHAELCDVGEFVEALRRFKRFIRWNGLEVALKDELSS